MTNAPLAGLIQRPFVQVRGAKISEKAANLLIDCRTSQTVGTAGQAVLRWLDMDYSLVDSTLVAVGDAITVGFGSDHNAVSTVFEGTVSNIGLETGPGDEPILTVTAYDKAFKIGRNSVTKVWANQSYGDILRAIASSAGLSLVAPTSALKFEHTMQLIDDMTMLDLISTRLGCVWYVESGKLHLAEPSASGAAKVTLEMRAALRRFRAQSSISDISQSVTVRGWDATSKAAIVGTHTAAPTASSTAPIVDTTRSKAKTAAASKRLTTRSVLSSNEAKDLAKALHQRSSSEELHMRGECDGTPTVKLGSIVEVKGVGTKLSGKYFLTSVEHVYTTSDYRTRFESGGTRPSRLVDLFERGAQSERPSTGPFIGSVTEVGAGNFEGKVKVSLPAFGESVASTWARVVSVGAGAKRGFMVLPSIGDEVLVMFEDADLRRPVVLGGLWNGKDKPPKAVVAKQSKLQEWVMKSPSGHTISFRDGDSPDKKNVEIALSDTTIKLHIGEDKVELFAKSGKPLQLKSGNASITLTASGDVQIKGNKVSITAETNAEVKGGANAEIKAGAALTLKGGAKAELAGPMVDVKGDGVTQIKGGIVKIN
jgi:phage protein D/phage baseplate assembly protein gpV